MMIMISRGLKGRVLKKLKEVYQFHQNQSVRRRRERFIFAVMEDAPIKQGQAEYVPNTEQSKRKRLAVMMDVPTKLLVEEFVSNTEPRKVFAVKRDVPIGQGMDMEEFVPNTEQSKR